MFPRDGITTLKRVFFSLKENILLICLKREAYLVVGQYKFLLNQKKTYQNLVERFIYLSYIHLEIAIVVIVASKFMHALGLTHFEAIYRILKYL